MQLISLSTGEVHNLKRQHVKHELMDYRYYCHKQSRLEEKLDRLNQRLKGEVSGAPSMGSGGTSTAKGSWIPAAISERDLLKAEISNIATHTRQIEAWLGLLESDRDIYNAIYCYVVMYNCTEAEQCTKDLKLKNAKMLYRYVEQGISKILEKF